MKTTLEAISEISTLMQAQNFNGVNPVWNILTALRGPDFNLNEIENTGLPPYESHELKSATTAVLRYHFLKASDHELGTSGNFSGSYYTADSVELCEIRKAALRSWREKPTKMGHFLVHVRSAFEAMGLKWNEVNYSPAQHASEDMPKI
jgi:hypothetical protein